MPRGRHRHSPPLHRLLPPSAIAGVSVVCALGPWVFSEQTMLRTLAAAAAATAVVGAVVMRRWDIYAGKEVADLTRARAGDEWRFEERVAELETDLEESREVRGKLEKRLRAKRAELAGLRNEHAALLRRYATAETERASALEGRRLLEIEAAPSSLALPPAGAAEEAEADTEADESVELAEDAPVASGASGVFSPEGSQLFLRARVALARFGTGDEAPEDEAVAKGAAKGAAKRAEGGEVAAKGESVGEGVTASAPEPASESASEDEEQGQPEAVDGHEHAAAATTTTAPAEPAPAASQPTGHFTVPTAVAVVPAAAPVRRPAVEGGFDFFGTQKEAPSGALDAVQNEDLADVVGQEALALHKAESEAHFKPADEGSRGVGQVIDLTAHDETEQIDMQGLRSAAS
ncbi:hypothetical protein ABZ915_42760 [Streptomyces sp. NPDC046915]|uniref:hypothetical protein n=1 Tax=Streptomyces sp. NPDC046915 TaxID=3155257 RepID=UPI0033F855FA